MGDKQMIVVVEKPHRTAPERRSRAHSISARVANRPAARQPGFKTSNTLWFVGLVPIFEI